MQPKPEWGPALPQYRKGRYAPKASDAGTQSDFTTMWTQTRIVLARTPMPSTMNLAATSCTIPANGNEEEIFNAIKESRSLTDLEMVDAAAGTPDESLLSGSLPTSVPIAIPPRILALRDSECGHEELPLTTTSTGTSPPPMGCLEVRIPGTSPVKDESSV